eukprot:4320861-Pyramimonas_sp.AAC.1
MEVNIDGTTTNSIVPNSYHGSSCCSYRNSLFLNAVTHFASALGGGPKRESPPYNHHDPPPCLWAR